MLFILTILIMIVSFVLVEFSDDIFRSSIMVSIISITASAVSVIAALVMSLILILNNIVIRQNVPAYRVRYESLVYQYENNLYENDNDVGKKELMYEIQEWNEDLANGKAYQRDFWVGIFIPNIYDEFDFIEVDGHAN